MYGDGQSTSRMLTMNNHLIHNYIGTPITGCQLVRTEGEGESNPAEDSTSITKLVGRQTIVKKRKATAEGLGSGRNDVDVAVGLAKATILPPHSAIEKLSGQNDEVAKKMKASKQSEKAVRDALVKELNSFLQ
ncbi:unnamed protein product, partial [Ilex paraguariensis]